MRVCKQKDIVIVSGFHSKMERDVLKILLQGECGIIVVLARGMYRKLPKQYEEAMLQNRLLIISYEKESVIRVSEATAHKRNNYVREIADEMQTSICYYRNESHKLTKLILSVNVKYHKVATY